MDTNPMAPRATVPDPGRERLHQLAWVSVIAGFFLIQAIIWLVAISLTAGDPSHAVVADYGADVHDRNPVFGKKLHPASQPWELSITFVPGEHGTAVIEVHLADQTGAPVAGARVGARLFHCARASEVREMELIESDPGTYRAKLDRARRGRWQIELQATRGQDSFHCEQRAELAREGTLP